MKSKCRAAVNVSGNLIYRLCALFLAERMIAYENTIVLGMPFLLVEVVRVFPSVESFPL